MIEPMRTGTVVGQFGRHCLVQDRTSLERRICHARGKKSQAVVGDVVDWRPSADEGTVERVHERRNVLYRQDELRTKTFAANLDHVLLWLAAEPVFSESQLTRALVACEAAGIAATIVLNKADLAEPFATAWARLAPYRAMGYPVLGLCLKREHDEGLSTLLRQLQGRATLVLGPSGGGKSSFVNATVPGVAVATAEISQALNSGKHTTTSTTWYPLSADGSLQGGALIDSPGFQEFGLHHIEPTALAGLMPDLAQHLGHCKFYNCTHLHEPQCGVRAQVLGGAEEGSADASARVFDEFSEICRRKISANRYSLYSSLFAELGQPQY